ncbi:uncharacterized protein BDFB_004867, partial [Asbolus verrucosus]
MQHPQEFWETLQKKYEEKNKTLQKREIELRHRLEAMDVIIGDSGKSVNAPRSSTPIVPSAPPPSPIMSSAPLLPDHISNRVLNYPDFKSCTCQPPQERTGFFQTVFSMFTSSKPKNPSPQSAPQDMPTKEVKQPANENTPAKTEEAPGIIVNGDIKPKTSHRGYINENCMCNPCMTEELAIPQKDNDFCNCSICTAISNTKDDSSCICSDKKDNSCVCSIDSKSSDKKDFGIIDRNSDLCTCSICSKMSGNKNLCYCNQDKLTETEIQNYSPAIKTETIETKKVKNSLGAASQLSLKSMDLHYMKNIHDLATQHKNTECSCNLNENVVSDSGQRSIAELKLENFLLKNELKEMRLEVRQYLERMEGPMQFKIESERYKCLQLEQKLEQAAKELADTQDLYQKEINSLKMQLCTANTNNYNLATINDKLGEDTAFFKNKCAELQDDLVRQKISEAETLKRMQATLNAQNNAMVVKDECSLHQIARELSKILKDCEPCGECINLPEDLTIAAKLLKSLTDMVDQKLPKDQEDQENDAGMVDQKSQRSVKESISGPNDEKSEKNMKESKKSCECSFKKAKEGILTSSSNKKSCKCSKKSTETREPPSQPLVENKVSTISSKRSCKCDAKSTEIVEPTPTDIVALPPSGDGVDQIWPKGSERFMLSHQVTSSRSKELLKSETSIKCLKVKENFPFDVDTRVDVIDKRPDGVHVTTTITNSGTLEVITEGPEGVIETTLVYTNSGNVEVITEILEYHAQERTCKRGTIKASSQPSEPKAIEPPSLKATTSEPAKSSDTPSGLELNASPSGPAVMNPNCQCIECPGLEPLPPT